MKRFYNLVLFAAFVFGITFSLSCSNGALSFRGVKTTQIDVVPKMIKPYLASVELLTVSGRTYCSGTIIKNEAGKPMAVLTAHHCIDGQDNGIYISTAYDGIIRKMLVVKIKSELDLALIISQEPMGRNGPYVRFAKKDPKVGEEIWVIGCPSGEPRVVTNGIVSKKQKSSDRVRNYLRITAPAYYGNSGGGIFNKRGQLTGVLTNMEMGYNYVIGFGPEGPQEIDAVAVYPKPGGFLAASLVDIIKLFKK